MREMVNRQNVCHAIAIISLFAFQGLNLDCDPSPLKRVNEFNDEGYWNHAPRCKVLFDTFVPDEFNQGVVASPLFTLVQWGVFSVRGVSIHSARLWPMASLWLSLLMVYFLVRRASSPGPALLAVAMLGFLHEMLTFTKWSTPIPPEICFIVAVFTFLELARSHNAWWAVAAATSFVAAALTTTLSLHCLAGILLFLAVMLLVRKEITLKAVVIFVATGFVLALAVGLGYFLPNIEQIHTFMRTIGKDNIQGLGYGTDLSDVFGPAPESRLLALFFEPFSSPGMATLMMIASLWLVDLIVRFIKVGFWRVVREMPALELSCICWIGGSLPTLMATPYMPARRFIILFVPIGMIVALFVRRVWLGDAADCPGQPSVAENVPRGFWRIPIWGALVAVWGEYICRSLTVINSRWLNWTPFNLSADPKYFAAFVVAMFSLAAVISGIYVLSRRIRLTVAILLISFAVINVGLDLVWSLNTTFTIRDASRALARHTQPKQYFLDGWSWELSLENRCLPIFSPWYCYWGNINDWFVAESKRVDFLLCRTQAIEGCLLKADPTRYPFPPRRAAFMPEVGLCPVVFATDKPRYVAGIYLIENGKTVNGKGYWDIRNSTTHTQCVYK